MRLTYDGKKFIFKCAFSERAHPRDAGFVFIHRVWQTENAARAGALRRFADALAEQALSKMLIEHRPWLYPLVWPRHFKLKAFQQVATQFALERNRSYLALDPGLGKTVIAAVTATTLKTHRPLKQCFVYVCPPFLVLNVRDEFRKWANFEPYLLPDSLLHKKKYTERMLRFIKRCEGHERVLFVDEAHRYKNEEAKRTSALFELLPHFDRVIFLSGTPMPNRPIELYSVLSRAAPECINFMTREDYGHRYCGAFFDQYAWNFSGHSNLKELRERVMGKFMLRYKKQDVLPELPPKTEEMVFLGESPPEKVAELEGALLRKHSPEDLVQARMGSEHISTYRRVLGSMKVAPTIEYLKELLDSSESILVFAYHKEVIEELERGLEEFRPIVITGQTHMQDRHALVQLFQTDETRRVLIGQIQACGVGFTLTKATRVVFVEYSWVPAENEQASDRAHRIGQRDHVFVQYLVYRNSIDRKVLETVLKKRKVINQLEGGSNV